MQSRAPTPCSPAGGYASRDEGSGAWQERPSRAPRVIKVSFPEGLDVQWRLLPQLPVVDGAEIAVRYRPAGPGASVGGDWYDAFVLPGGDLALVIGDVMGHDREAASTMGQLRALVRGLASGSGDGPSSVLDRLDRAVDQLQLTDLASVLVACVERREEAIHLRWCSAGHPPPLLTEPAVGARFLEGGEGLVVGVVPATRRVDALARLGAGATVVFYTDGLVESRHKPVDTGLAQLLDAGSRLAARPLGVLCDRLLEEMGPSSDDVAMLAIRVTGPA